MSNKNLIIKQLSRITTDGDIEDLQFTFGVNIIVGNPNTGKTMWLKTLDFLLGDLGTPESVFGSELAAKYSSASVVVLVDGEEINIERRWKEKGLRSKIIVQDTAIAPVEFSDYLLDKLDIPLISFPQGDPFTERTWPRLSWRMLLRHIYRQERFWNDFVPKQPPSEQYACLLQFLGLAKDVFPQELGELIEARKYLIKLQAKKEQFVDVLSEISQELISQDGLSVTLTPDSIALAIGNLQERVSDLEKRRSDLLTALQKSTNVGIIETEEATEEKIHLSDEWAKLRAERDNAANDLEKMSQRLRELTDYQQSIEQELSRLRRAQVAGGVLATLRFTSCPACDQPLASIKQNETVCFLCHRPTSNEITDNLSERRVEFEIDQLKEELGENKRLAGELSKKRNSLVSFIRQADDRLKRLESLLKPARIAAAAILPPELPEIDQEVGRANEQIRQLEGLSRLLDTRDQLSSEIDDAEHNIAELDARFTGISESVDLEQSGDIISDGMNTYLNELNKGGQRWPRNKGAVRAQIGTRRFRILVDSGEWSAELGATLQCYLFTAYHYALMRLSSGSRYNYPGFVILDFPPTLADGTEVADKENYMIEPFIQLMSQHALKNTQLIAAGRAFEGLNANNRIELTNVWM